MTTVTLARMQLARMQLARLGRGAARAARPLLRPPAPDAPGRLPTPPEGWAPAPPSFVGVAAMKSGTSWWYHLIASHPRVFHAPGRHKEVHFFDRFWRAELTAEDIAHYGEYFPRPPGGLAGEWTPRYMFDFWSPPLLVQAAPQAKILVMLRDPVERYRSGLAHDLSRGAGPRAGMAQDHFERGLYHAQLERLLHHLPRDQILVLQYERCVTSPRRELERTYRFLGLDEPDFAPPDLARPVNATSSDKPVVAGAVRSTLRSAYELDVRLLLEAFPEIDVDLWPNFTPR